HSFQLVTVTAAFPPQLAGQRGGGSNRINAVSHGPLLCRLIQDHYAATAKPRFPNRENDCSFRGLPGGDAGIELATRVRGERYMGLIKRHSRTANTRVGSKYLVCEAPQLWRDSSRLSIAGCSCHPENALM